MKLHQLKGYVQAIYLIEEDNGLLLLDGCCRADIHLVCDYITNELRRPLSDLKIIIVTHMHADHAGGAKGLQKRCGSRIATVKKERHWYQGFSRWFVFETDLMLTTLMALKMKKPLRYLRYSRILEPDIIITGGDRVPGFEDWQIVDTPGHTDRDLSVLHEPSKQIYVADLLIKIRTKYVPPFPIFHPNQYRQSLENIESLNPSQVWLAHGGRVELSHEDYQSLKEQAPNRPKTLTRLIKRRFRQIKIRT